MMEAIKEYEEYPFIRTFKSIAHEEYLSLMKLARVMVGNSSSGIIEAPSFGLPVVNVGTRQIGRQRAENVIDVPYDKGKIKKAINTALFDQKFRQRARNCSGIYGDGRAGKRIANILSQTGINKRLLQKRMTY